MCVWRCVWEAKVEAVEVCCGIIAAVNWEDENLGIKSNVMQSEQLIPPTSSSSYPRLRLLTHLFLLAVFATVFFSSFTTLVCLPSTFPLPHPSLLPQLPHHTTSFFCTLNLFFLCCFVPVFIGHSSPSFSFHSVLHVFILPSLSPFFSFSFPLFSPCIPSFFSSFLDVPSIS